MNDLKELERRIQEKLAAAEHLRTLRQEHLQQQMGELERKHERFSENAERLIRTVVQPRVEKLASYFDNAELLGADQAGRHHCTCRFAHAERFPATTKLDFACCHDEQLEKLVVFYTLEILPILFPYNRQDEVVFPVDRVDEKRLAAWVDQKIVEFVEAYLRLEHASHYQKENLVTDPVCGMRINKTVAAAQMEYAGQIHYFCAVACRTKFAENPQRYVTAIKA